MSEVRMVDVSQEDYKLLKRIKDYEDTMEEESQRLGWRWHDVGAYTATINKFVVKGLVRVSYKSRAETRYRLTEKATALLEIELPGEATVLGGKVERIEEPKFNPEEMFSDIIGYDDIKELLRESLQLDKPIHVLLYGPPSLAKSMFLWDIERAFGDLSLPLLGSATSHAGLWDLIAERRPRVILVDEIEKMGLVDMAGLLSIMQTGRIIRAKVGRKLDEKINAWVIRAANRIHKLPPELILQVYGGLFPRNFSLARGGLCAFIQTFMLLFLNFP
ncbi:hypothetical protein ES703_115840 [subsurface metagenome]